MVPAAAVIPSHLVYIIFVAFTKYVDGLFTCKVKVNFIVCRELCTKILTHTYTLY